MPIANPRSTVRIAKHPIHPMLVPIPIVCFVGGLLTDLTYWQTANMMWADFSAWLVTVGVITAYLVARVVVLVLATLNMFVHSRDAWTSVVPWGLTLSAAVVLISLFTGWMGGSMVYRHGVGSQNEVRLQNLRAGADLRLGD